MAEKIYICSREECKVGFEKYAYLNSHFLGKHPGESPPPKEECGVDVLPEGYTLRSTKSSKKAVSASNSKVIAAQDSPPESSPPPPQEDPPQGGTPPVYRTTPELSNILRSILTKYPGLPGGVAEEILDWEEQQGSPLHPSQVAHLLNQMAGVPKGASEIIPQKYSLAMQKAAQQGNAEVQMTVAGWQYGPQNARGNPLTMMPGQMFNPQPGNQTGMPPIQYNVPFQQPTYPNYPGYPYYAPYTPNAPQQAPPQEGVQASQEIDARFRQMKEEMNETVTGLANAVQALSSQLLETEEQKKEAALNARFDSIEKALIQLANTPKTDESANAFAEAIKSIQSEIATMREEAAANKITALEDRIAMLTETLAKDKDDEIVNLRKQLEEIQKIASEKKEVTGRTEMDLISDLATKALSQAGELGKDVKAVLLRQANAQDFDPKRTNLVDRAKVGEKITSIVENEAKLVETEDKFRYV